MFTNTGEEGARVEGTVNECGAPRQLLISFLAGAEILWAISQRDARVKLNGCEYEREIFESTATAAGRVTREM